MSERKRPREEEDSDIVRHPLTKSITRARISGWGLPNCLLEQGSSVDTVDVGGMIDGSTPLTAALTVCYDHSGITFIQKLLESKADPNMPGTVFYSEVPVPPVVAAVRCGRSCRSIVMWQLLSAGADLGIMHEKRDMLSSMLRYRQCFRKDADLETIACLLIDKGLDVNIPDLEEELQSQPQALANITNKATMSRYQKARVVRLFLADVYNSDELGRNISACVIEYL